MCVIGMCFVHAHSYPGVYTCLGVWRSEMDIRDLSSLLSTLFLPTRALTEDRALQLPGLCAGVLGMYHLIQVLSGCWGSEFRSLQFTIGAHWPRYLGSDSILCDVEAEREELGS